MKSLSHGAQRSLALYLDPAREAALDAFYSAFIGPDELVFDVGAHVGDRTECFRRLGARVVALEPQPELAALLRARHQGDACVQVIEAAAGANEGVASMHINSDNPTVSTLSPAFIAAAAGAAGWEGQDWSAQASVPVTTLDALVARFGAPAFVKVDVEGYELECLRGLSLAPRALSFEFTTIQRDVAFACVDALERSAPRRYRASLGETFRFEQAEPVDAATICAWIAQLPAEANSGDVYAFA